MYSATLSRSSMLWSVGFRHELHTCNSYSTCRYVVKESRSPRLNNILRYPMGRTSSFICFERRRKPRKPFSQSGTRPFRSRKCSSMMISTSVFRAGRSSSDLRADIVGGSDNRATSKDFLSWWSEGGKGDQNICAIRTDIGNFEELGGAV